MKPFLYESQRFNNIFALHDNIKVLNINFKIFHNLLNNTGSCFNIILSNRKWCSDPELANNSSFNSCNTILFERKAIESEGSVLIYVKTKLMYKSQKNLSSSYKDKHNLTIEIISKKDKNYLLSYRCRYLKGIIGNLFCLSTVFEIAQNEFCDWRFQSEMVLLQ